MAYKNKEDQAKAAHSHYLKNKEKIKARAQAFTKELRAKNKKYILDYLKDKYCIDCGESDSIVLEFDHVLFPKLGNIGSLIQQGIPLKKLQLEIDKCEIRCANCHRKLHYKQSNKIL